jgi:hypothetical protein
MWHVAIRTETLISLTGTARRCPGGAIGPTEEEWPMRRRPVQRAPIVRRTAAKITQRISGKLPDEWY